MATITIKVPQNIQVEYEIDNVSVVNQLLEQLATEPPAMKQVKPDRLLGLFAEEAELLDEITTDLMQTRETTPLRYQHR